MTDKSRIIKQSSFMTEIRTTGTPIEDSSEPVIPVEMETPRPYQAEIFRKAKESNVIAVLDTGTGKTLISLLLLKHMASLEPSPSKKVSAFLVPTIPLVSQQATYITTHSNLKVGQYRGGNNNLSWTSEEWQAEMLDTDVFVMTPYILLNAMDHGSISMKNVNLIVFDECHHARSSHPYNLLMKTHYSMCLEQDRPKIFGMTASPCISKESARSSILHIENNLKCKAVTSSSYEQLLEYVSRPSERIVYYTPGDFFSPPKLYLTIIQKYPKLMAFLEREIGDAMSFCDVLGPWAADRALEYSILDLEKFMKKCLKKLTLKPIESLESDLVVHQVLPTAKNFEEFIETMTPPNEPIDTTSQEQDMNFSVPLPSISQEEKSPNSNKVVVDDQSNMLKRNHDQIDDVDFEDIGMVFKQETRMFNELESLSQDELNQYLDFCDELQRSPEWGGKSNILMSSDIGSKVNALVNILMEYENEEDFFCGIVFCQQRVMARVLQRLIAFHPKLDFIKSACLLGHGTRSKGTMYKQSSTMSVINQRAIVNNFRTGKLNLLIATNVAEEGLDIKPCNCVIRFDMMEMNLINYIQSRGRARHKSSQFIVLAQQGDDQPENLLKYLKFTENKMRDTLYNDDLDDKRADFKENDIKPAEIYRIKKTEAMATLYNAMSLLYQYCSVLPRSAYYTPIPEFLLAKGPSGYACQLHMPRNIRADCSKLRGPICSSAANAKREVAFRMIKLLHSCGELDDDLKPAHLFTKDPITGEIKRKIGIQNLSKNRKVRSHTTGIPSAFEGSWEVDTTVYLNIVHLCTNDDAADDTPDDATGGRFLAVGFLSFSKPSQRAVSVFPFKIGGIPHTVKVFTLKKKLKLEEDLIAKFKNYHFEFFSSILRSTMSVDYPWSTLCVPLIVDEADSVSFSRTTDPLEIIDFVALDFCSSVDRSDVSFIADETLSWNEVRDYVLYDEYRYGRNFVMLEIKRDQTPLTDISMDNAKFKNVNDIYKYRFNYPHELNPDQVLVYAEPLGYPYHYKKSHVNFQKVMLVPQVVTMCPIKRPHVLEARIFPILLRTITHRLLVSDILKNVPFTHTNIKLPTTMDLLQKAFTAPSANLDFNYERLEFLGDSFLKVYLTTHLFVSHPFRHEGYLSQCRIELENNNHLRKSANNLNLEAYILGDPFSRQHYIPPMIGNEKGQMLSDKTVADVVEASIGACILNAQENGGCEAVKFFLGDQFQTDLNDYSKLWKASETAGPNSVEPSLMKGCVSIQQQIGYSFKNINILVEALTHASAIMGGNSYERLEYLGDSVLGYVVTKFLYKLKPSLQPGPLSDLRSELVNNQFLGAITISLGFHNYLSHMNEELGMAISTWATDFQILFASTELAIGDVEKSTVTETEKLLFWNYMAACPKTIGDIYESILGAVYLDSDFKMEFVEKVMEKTLFEPWWHRFSILINDKEGIQSKHPMRELSDLINTLKCNALVMEVETLRNGLNQTRLKLHDLLIGVESHENKKDAKKMAAFKAVSYINSDLEKIKILCDCSKKETENDTNNNVNVSEKKQRKEYLVKQFPQVNDSTATSPNSGQVSDNDNDMELDKTVHSPNVTDIGSKQQSTVIIASSDHEDDGNSCNGNTDSIFQNAAESIEQTKDSEYGNHTVYRNGDNDQIVETEIRPIVDQLTSESMSTVSDFDDTLSVKSDPPMEVEGI
ncbi:hypothetical protein BC833DRAFT_183137 [Globomyces pollinis-pini]|nr:hypothetical protein BC833DRAFT_183137 [Globomyces pollinis-pini]